MKKGVILSVNKFSITLLTPDGEFDKSRRLNRNYEIGEEIRYQPVENPLKSFSYILGKKTAIISSVVTCIMLLSIVIPHFSTHVSAYMTIDVNPSIELGLDDELQVVEMEGINADGKRVISQIQEWKNKDVSYVAEKIVLKTKELGYFNDSTRKIIVSKTMLEDDKKLDKQLNQEIKGFTNEISISNAEVKLIHATENDRNKAKQKGISTGKFIEQKLDEEKRKNEKSDLEKKNDNEDNVNSSYSLEKDKQVSNNVHAKETHDHKKVKPRDQYLTANHIASASAESSKDNQTDKYANTNDQLENKENSKIKTTPGNKENSKIKSCPGNKGNSGNKKNSGNKGNSQNKGNTKGNSGNKDK